ncbi:MAG TPA: hypothetical protein VMW58_06980 [Anaerolineae bacterium]|nr:hypothetical protein [Anaerolineae bacterium]
MRERMRTWWGEWGYIDVIGLGVGALLVWGFVVYRHAHPASRSAYLDLWPNIATEIIGVWISVRLIDAIIRSRERRHGVRRELVFNLNFLRSKAEQLLPHIDSYLVQTLRQELVFARERMPKRNRYLESGEVQTIAGVLSTLEGLVGAADEYGYARRRAEICWTAISEVTDGLNQERQKLNEAIASIDVSHDADYETSAMEVEMLLAESGPSLAPVEHLRMRQFSKDLESFRDLRGTATGYLDKPRVRHLSEWEIPGLRAVEQRLRPSGDYDVLDREPLSVLIEASKKDLLKGELPRTLSDAVVRFLESMEQMAQLHNHTRSAADDLILAIEAARYDLLQETELD